MTLEIKIPSPGESITEVEIGKWLVQDGAIVEKDQEIAEVESDKATFSLSASQKGKIKILLKEGQRVAVGSTACIIEPEAAAVKSTESKEPKIEEGISEGQETQVENRPKMETGSKVSQETGKELSGDNLAEPAKESSVTQEREIQQEFIKPEEDENHAKVKATAAARAVMDSEGLSMDEIISGIHRLTRQDVEKVVPLLKGSDPEEGGGEKKDYHRSEERIPMSALRRKLSQRLVSVKNETAMLTTFNEIDMSRLGQLRTRFQKSFTEKHGIKLGYMSFFTKASSIALTLFPAVNSMIDGEEIVYPSYQDIGIAVQTDKGLMVPVIRDAGIKNTAQLEREIAELAERARNRKLTVQEMTGGTFTITNGGVFGSLMSTPILNPPQSAILGMHTIKDRPIAVDYKIEIRPMMYVALSYDHRVIDGRDAVSFLVKVKELIENPAMMIWGGKAPEDLLLDL